MRKKCDINLMMRNFFIVHFVAVAKVKFNF